MIGGLICQASFLLQPLILLTTRLFQVAMATHHQHALDQINRWPRQFHPQAVGQFIETVSTLREENALRVPHREALEFKSAGRKGMGSFSG